MKATHKAIVSLAVTALLMALAMVFSFRAFRAIERPAEARKNTFVLMSRAGDFLSALKDAETGQRGYALTGDEAFLEPYLETRGRVRDQLAELRQLTANSAARQHLDAVAPLLDAKLAELESVIDLRRNHDLPGVVTAVRGGQGKRLMDAIRTEMSSFLQIEERALALRDAELQASMRRLFTMIIAAGVLAVLSTLSFAYFLYREAQHRLTRLVHLETVDLLRVQEEMNGRLQQAHVTLQASEAKLAVTLDSIGDAVIATDAEGRVTLLNPLAERLTGWTQAEASKRPMDEVFHIVNQKTRQPSLNPVTAALANGATQSLANGTVLIARDGSECAIADSCAPIRDRDGHVFGAVLVFRDVTEDYAVRQALRESAILLRQKNDELETASRLKSEFLANMSHELRTPLNAIIGFSEVLRDGLLGNLTDQQRGFIGDIFGSGKHLLSLINDILDLSKVEAGKMVLDLEAVEVSSLLANGLSIIREKAAARHIRMDLDIAEELGSIQADPRKVKQIVYNLLANAVKFTNEGGQVTLGARRVPRVEVGRLSGAAPGRAFPLVDSEFAEFLEVSVTDDGIGISRGGLERLFEPFTQIDGGLARQFEGTGLGLAMIKLLAELHGGAVAVESAEGQGARFRVWLPLRRRTPRPEPPPKRQTETLEGARIALVVEDDYKSSELIRVHLEAEGFKVLHASSAEAGLALAAQQPLSLITLDIILPDMDGWEFLARLKQVRDLRRIPVVIISIVPDRNRGFALGAAAVMQKPVSRQELYESLVDLGLFPLPPGQALKVLVVDDDPQAVELIAVRIKGLASTILRAHGGQDAIDAARRELPDLIVLDLMMPGVNGFDVVEALHERPATARIPILVVTAKQITAGDRAKLNGYVTTIMEKAEFDRERFTAEVRRAMSLRRTGPGDDLATAVLLSQDDAA